MKRIAMLTVLVLGLAPVSGTDAQVTGRIFRVGVRSSFGTTFMDCFRFDVPSTGDLTIDNLFQTITYRHGQLDQVDTRFKAVSRSGQPLSIMFYGEEIEGLELLVGEAVSAFGDTFVFAGMETSSCATGTLSVENYYQQ
jgi:hypothetical protein